MSKKATIIAVVNQKGGTGKTTTTENLGVGLALEGKKVLLVDTDPQASLTVSLGNPCPVIIQTQEYRSNLRAFRKKSHQCRTGNATQTQVAPLFPVFGK